MRDPKELQVRFNFHPELCVGCGACVGACLDEKDAFPVAEIPLRRLKRHETAGGRITWYSLACLHCESSECVEACPKDCYARDPATGTVQLDSSACIGCGACVRACRYEGVVYDAAGKATKCDGCLERLRLGLLPRCVEACPRYAITVDDRPAVRRASQERLRKEFASKKLLV